MKKNFLKISGILLFSTLLYACTDTNVTPNTANYVKITDVVSSGSSFNVAMYINDSLYVGKNKVYFKVTDISKAQTINNVVLTLNPVFTPASSTATSSVENPSSTQNSDGLYEGTVTFSVIGTNNWSISVEVKANDKTETVKLDIKNVYAAKP